MDERRFVDGSSLYREAVTFQSPGSPPGTTAKQWSAAHPGIPAIVHSIRRRRFTNIPGERIVGVRVCQTPSGFCYALSLASQGGAAAPLTLGCGM
jgi:hypothetical protein